MTPDDIDTLRPGDWLDWHVPAKPDARRVQYIAPVPDRDGRITVWNGDHRRTVHIRNCTRIARPDGQKVTG